MPTGAALHFPAGSYQAQVASDLGHAELELMNTVWRVWYLKEMLPLDKHSITDMKFLRWVEGKEKPETDKLQQMVEMIWQ